MANRRKKLIIAYSLIGNSSDIKQQFSQMSTGMGF